MVKGDKAQPKEVEAHATMIGNTAQKAVRGLGTMIWAANPRNDTLERLAQYIIQYSYDFFQGSPVLCHLDLPAEVPALPLTAEVRHNLFMVVKEALHNILKHASEVRLSLKLHEAVLELRSATMVAASKLIRSLPVNAAAWLTCDTEWRPSVRP